MRVLIQRRDGLYGWSTQLFENPEAARFIATYEPLVELIDDYHKRLSKRMGHKQWSDLYSQGPLKLDHPVLNKLRDILHRQWALTIDPISSIGLFVFDLAVPFIIGQGGRQEYLVAGRQLPDKWVEFTQDCCVTI